MSARPRKAIMTRRLTKIGNSRGLIVPNQILDLLGITMETDLEVTTDGYGLFLVPTNHPEIKKIRAMHKDAILRYALEGEDRQDLVEKAETKSK